MIYKHCYKCGAMMPLEAARCPECSARARFYGELKYRIEHSNLYLAGVVVVALLLVGAAWLVRMSTGLRWPLYVLLVALAPLVPWVLERAYLAAAPKDAPDADRRP